MEIVHWSHFETIFDDLNIEISKNLKTAWKWWIIWEKITDIFYDSKILKNKKVISLLNSENPISLGTLIFIEKEDENPIWLSFFPCFSEWNIYKWKLLEIIEWENKVEWYLKIEVLNRNFSFYDLKYLENKEKYKIWEKYEFNLSGLSYFIEKFKDNFIEANWNEEMIDSVWMKKEYDENWKLKPVKFFMWEFDTLLQKEYPWDVEFIAKITNISEFESFQKKFLKLDFTIKFWEDWDYTNIPFTIAVKENILKEEIKIWDQIQWVFYLQWFLN